MLNESHWSLGLLDLPEFIRLLNMLKGLLFRTKLMYFSIIKGFNYKLRII